MTESTNRSEAVTVAIRHIGLGVYSSGKIREYLLKKGYSYEICDEAVKELILRKYIDDERAGRKVLLSRVGKKQESRGLLYKRLLAAGISEDTASSIISGLDDDTSTCLNLIKACYIDPSTLGDDPMEACNDVIKTCVKRGYTPDVASKSFRLWLEQG